MVTRDNMSYHQTVILTQKQIIRRNNFCSLWISRKKSSQLIPLRLLEIKSVEILAISFLLIVLRFGYFSLYKFFLFRVHLFNDKILPLLKKRLTFPWTQPVWICLISQTFLCFLKYKLLKFWIWQCASQK